MDVRTDARRERPPLWRELLVGLGLFAVYLLVDSPSGQARESAARTHGDWIRQAEQWLHIDVESWANHTLVPHQTLTIAANYEYATTYILSAAALLIVTYWRNPIIYRLTRNSFVVVNLLAFCCFWLFPVLPPRLLDGGFVDTVSRDNTVGSWGSPLVAHANQLAAMPSLHIAWALWVSVMLARLSHARWIQIVSGLHVAVTFVVVTATANHYLLDAVGAAVVVGVGVLVADAWTREPGRLATEDEFFLNVEKSGVTQNVGGYVILDPDSGSPPTLHALHELARTALGRHERFLSRLERRRRRLHWVRMPVMDWDAHVSQVHVPTDTTRTDLDRMVARLQAEPLPRDRPLWRIVLITGLPGGQAAFVVLLHHCMADGIGSVAQLLSLVRPPISLPTPEQHKPSRTRSAMAVTAGLAQLATDGAPSARLPQGRGRTELCTVHLDFAEVRGLARAHRARVTELLLALAASSVAAEDPDLAGRLDHRLRVSVPVMLGLPGDGAAGNTTAAAILDVPCHDAPLADTLPQVRRAAARLRTPTRPLASRWVMSTALRVLPATARSAFARTVYGRRFFHAIVSNIPGPDVPGSILDARMDQVYPLLPPAPGAPLTVGALTWDGHLGVSVTTDPDVLDAERVAERIRSRLADESARRSQRAVAP